MPSTYTVNLGIEKPATGEQSGTWGDTTNVNFDIIDQAVNGSERVTLTSAGTSGSPNDLNIVNGSTTSSEGRNKWLEIYSASDLGGSAYVRLVPNDAEKILFIRNSLAGSQSVLLFQGTYNASNDLEIPAGVDMVVKFDGAGASATVTDVFTKLRATEITTPTLTAGTADINGGSVDGATVGAASASTGAFTTLTASTSLNIASSTTVDGVLDEDNMASDSATKLATQQSIKAYVDSQVGAVDTLAEILANGNTSGANNLIIDNGQALTSNTINETTAGSGVTIDSVLLKDDGVNATNLEITNIKANDGTAAATIANSTGNFTITNFISNSVDIGGGAIDGTVIGGSTAAAGTFTTGQFNTSLNVDGTTNLDVVDIDGAVDMASTLTVGGTTNDGTALVQIAQSGTGRAFSVNRNVVSATRAVVNLAQLQASGGAEAVLDIQQTTPASRAIKVTPDGSIDRFSVYGTGALVTTPVAGGHAVFNEGGADADFRVESATTANALFVEGSSGNVGIGESNPASPLDIHVATDINMEVDSNASVLRISAVNDARSTNPAMSFQALSYDFRGAGGIGTRAVIDSSGGLITNPAAGGHAVFNEGGVDADFRVESDGNADMLFVDGGNNRVGVGMSTPLEPLHATGRILSTTTYGGSTQRIGTSIGQNGNTRADIDFRRWTGASTNHGVGMIEVADTGIMRFYVDSVTSNTPATTERISLDPTGAFTTTPAAGGHAVFNEGGADADFRVESDGNANMLFVDGGGNHVNIGTATDLSGVLNVDGNLSLSGAGTSNRYVGLLAETNAYAGTLVLQAGGGSAAYGAAVVLHGHSHATNPGMLYLAGSAGAGGKSVVIGRNGISVTAASEMLTAYSNGALLVINEFGNDQDFRVESDSNTHALFVDASVDRVGVNNSSPSFPLDVTGNARIQSSLTLGSNPSDPGSLILNDNSATAYTLTLKSTGTRDYTFEGSSSGGAYILNFNNADVASGMNVNFYGNAVFNQNGNDYDFRVESDANANMLFVDAGNNHVNIGTATDLGFVLNVNGSIGGKDDLNITSTGGENYTQGTLQISSSTIDTPTARGQGVLYFNEGHDVTWYTGTGYNQGGDFHIGYATGASLNTAAARVDGIDNSNMMFTIYRSSGAVFNELGNDQDFRVESDSNTHALFVDAGNSRVGINSSSPGYPLDVVGNIRATDRVISDDGQFYNNDKTVSIAALNTWTSLGVSTAGGLYVFRDATSGGMAVFSADSSAGATSIQNGITGFQMRYDLGTGQMQVQVTSGSGTRTIKWVSLLTNLS
jgi:hypothetical protein